MLACPDGRLNVVTYQLKIENYILFFAMEIYFIV